MLYEDDEDFNKKDQIVWASANSLLIPSRVIYAPSKYSWFRSKAVKTIVIEDKPKLDEIVKQIPLSEYPHLKKNANEASKCSFG